ncbi:ABC transporter ATP-binding protein [candidate division CSSED10-310 bacterium]|uniref:ABC transporter ATP-binding protein n=1 Tax=candidate division CSSED10-310 bacterium TaxID=2855610 RepID=A0ABV6Z1Z0_UNCC1
MCQKNGDHQEHIVIRKVSKWYGEVLGVNKVNLVIPTGITSLVGPNGSGKTTLMNLITGLIRPSKGDIRILDIPPDQPEKLFRLLGYSPQYGIGYEWLTGFEFLNSILRIHGFSKNEAEELALIALERVNMLKNKDRKIGSYSKGMHQRIKLALAIAHHPRILILDEPLHGLDPMARIELIDLFHQFAADKKLIVISSHILHEVEALSDNVVILNHGYVIAEGDVHTVRSEIKVQHPLQILIRCDEPSLLSARLFELDGLVSVNILEDQKSLLVRTRNIDNFYELINKLVTENVIDIETMTPADDNVQAVYDYLIRPGMVE